MPTPIVPVAIALGSNLGDRRAHLDYAAGRLSEILADVRISPYIETEPFGVASQPLYLNAAVVGLTGESPSSLLAELLRIEQERERARPYRGAPRTLDLDLILYGDSVIAGPDLEIPHPRFRDRPFVLEPLAAIAATMVDPVTGLTVIELLQRCSRGTE